MHSARHSVQHRESPAGNCCQMELWIACLLCSILVQQKWGWLELEALPQAGGGGKALSA